MAVNSSLLNAASMGIVLQILSFSKCKIGCLLIGTVSRLGFSVGVELWKFSTPVGSNDLRGCDLHVWILLEVRQKKFRNLYDLEAEWPLLCTQTLTRMW